MRFAPGHDIDFAFPGLQNRQGETGGAAETEESDAFALIHVGDAQTAESDDAGAQQRSNVDVIEAGRQWNREISPNRGVFGVTAIDGVAGESGPIAEIFHAVTAIPAPAVHTTHPGNADTRS